MIVIGGEKIWETGSWREIYSKGTQTEKEKKSCDVVSRMTLQLVLLCVFLCVLLYTPKMVADTKEHWLSETHSSSGPKLPFNAHLLIIHSIHHYSATGPEPKVCVPVFPQYIWKQKIAFQSKPMHVHSGIQSNKMFYFRHKAAICDVQLQSVLVFSCSASFYVYFRTTDRYILELVLFVQEAKITVHFISASFSFSYFHFGLHSSTFACS